MAVKKAFFYIAKKINLVSNAILLTVFYLIGIGVVSLLAKLLRKDFLSLEVKRSNWKEKEKVLYLDKMY